MSTYSTQFKMKKLKENKEIKMDQNEKSKITQAAMIKFIMQYSSKIKKGLSVSQFTLLFKLWDMQHT